MSTLPQAISCRTRSRGQLPNIEAQDEAMAQDEPEFQDEVKGNWFNSS